jgi:hypothetical protein
MGQNLDRRRCPCRQRNPLPTKHSVTPSARSGKNAGWRKKRSPQRPTSTAATSGRSSAASSTSPSTPSPRSPPHSISASARYSHAQGCRRRRRASGSGPRLSTQNFHVVVQRHLCDAPVPRGAPACGRPRTRASREFARPSDCEEHAV